MSKREINIELRSSGGKKVESDLSGVRKASTDLVVNIKKLGGAFGDLGSIAGNVLSNILKGGIWGIMAASVQGAMALCVKAWNKHKEAAEKAAEAAKEAFDKMTKDVADKIAAVGTAFTAAVTNIDKMTASYDKQTAAVKNHVLAQIELEKQRNIAGGMSTEEASAIIQKGLTLLFQ